MLNQIERLLNIRLVLLMAGLIFVFSACGGKSDSRLPTPDTLIEDTMVSYPGRTFSYKQKFNDTQAKQEQAAKAIGLATPPRNRQEAARMRSQLSLIKSNDNYIVDSLTHSIPYLVPAAAAELERIGEGFADILQRNGLPHYQFYVTSVLRTKEDIKRLQNSGNINATTNSCHNYGTTFDLAYFRFNKVTRTREYMHQDNLKLVLGQVLLNEQRAGRIYVKYEYKQACFHITVRE
ncbi:MAG: hypothetical protein J6J55_01275 [Paludibacteraceae bacterium]|nr:hypothetical protein [Paludibacteraceae bacterium]MBP3575104.1 hypothetical protein [Paludibacteraceae bacterium]